MATLAGITREPIKRPFRKAEIKRRRVTDGLYESSWLNITKYVESWGTLQASIDDLRANQFVFSGLNLQVRNDYGEFDPEYEGQSLFYGYLTRYRTLLRISAGYTDGSSNQFPTDATQGIFILDNEIVHNPSNNRTTLNCKSLISPFEETRADEIRGISASTTASEIFEKIKDATDGSGNFLFRNFITSTSWSIATTSTLITNLATTTSLAQFSVWELMNKLAEAEAKAVYITRSGGLVFGNRNPNTTSSQFSFFGAGFRSPNVIKISNYKETVNKLYTHVRLKYLEADTETSYATIGTQTVVSPTSSEWKYGRRTYAYENNFFLTTTSANESVSKVITEFGNLRSELELDAVFIPQLDLLDQVDVSYREGSVDSIHLWDLENWAADTTTSDVAPVLLWASETTATIDFNQKAFKILSRKTNLDTFVTSFKLREVEN